MSFANKLYRIICYYYFFIQNWNNNNKSANINISDVTISTEAKI